MHVTLYHVFFLLFELIFSSVFPLFLNTGLYPHYASSIVLSCATLLAEKGNILEHRAPPKLFIQFVSGALKYIKAQYLLF